jgi:glutamyl-tRNA reductase
MLSWPPFRMIGLSHRQADLGLRERFSRSRAEIAALLTGEAGPARTGVPLSTCNRFEVYWWGRVDWPEWFLGSADRSGAPVNRPAVCELSGGAAVRHLIRVTAGLDSQVVGEREILGQVRRAWSLARECGATGRELDLVFAGAIAAARKVRREAALGRPLASVGSVAVEFAQADCGGTVAGRRVLVIGAGQAARAVLAELEGREAHVCVVTRRLARAAPLVEAYGVPVDSWEALDSRLAWAEVAFAATSAPSVILTEDLLGRAGALTVFDLGVPRNVALAARALPGVRVFDLDDLDGASPEETGIRAALTAAEGSIDAMTARLLGKIRSLVNRDATATARNGAHSQATPAAGADSAR